MSPGKMLWLHILFLSVMIRVWGRVGTQLMQYFFITRKRCIHANSYEDQYLLCMRILLYIKQWQLEKLLYKPAYN